MGNYEAFMVAATIVTLISLGSFFSASWQDRSQVKSIVGFFVAAGLWYFTHKYSSGGINLGDIPGSFAVVIKQIF